MVMIDGKEIYCDSCEYSGNCPNKGNPELWCYFNKNEFSVYKSQKLSKMINDHWKYNEELIKISIGLTHERDGFKDEQIIKLCEYCYKKSWIHGVKHIIDDIENDGSLFRDIMGYSIGDNP